MLITLMPKHLSMNAIQISYSHQSFIRQSKFGIGLSFEMRPPENSFRLMTIMSALGKFVKQSFEKKDNRSPPTLRKCFIEK